MGIGDDIEAFRNAVQDNHLVTTAFLTRLESKVERIEGSTQQTEARLTANSTGVEEQKTLPSNSQTLIKDTSLMVSEKLDAIVSIPVSHSAALTERVGRRSLGWSAISDRWHGTTEGHSTILEKFHDRKEMHPRDRHGNMSLRGPEKRNRTTATDDVQVLGRFGHFVPGKVQGRSSARVLFLQEIHKDHYHLHWLAVPPLQGS